MARSVWKGVISFGMITIPVRLYVATESHSVTYRQLCREHLSPIRDRRWCQSGDHEVPYSDIVKGYEVAADSYVVVQDAELDNLPLPTARQIEINEFVPNDDIEAGLYFKSAYYIEPEQAGLKPYHLLRQALNETRMTAVAKIAFRDREHLCALRPLEGALLMNTLHWPDEIRPLAELKGVDGSVRLDPRELQMTRALVENLAEDRFDPQRFQDQYYQALMEVINAKVQGEEVVAAPEVEGAPPVMGLMEALQASVDQARKQRTARPRARRPARRRVGAG